MRVNEITENRDNLIKKINALIMNEEYEYNKHVKRTFFQRIINTQELITIKNASDEGLMADEDFKNIIYSIRNKLNDIRGQSEAIDNQTLLDNYIYVEELSIDLGKGNIK